MPGTFSSPLPITSQQAVPYWMRSGPVHVLVTVTVLVARESGSGDEHAQTRRASARRIHEAYAGDAGKLPST